MRLFGKRVNINESVAEFQNAENASLVDVREVNEYRTGHIPGAINVPLSQIASAESVLPDKSTTLYVYCLSGARSGRAMGILQKMGYKDVKNIGGINAYRGPVEK